MKRQGESIMIKWLKNWCDKNNYDYVSYCVGHITGALEMIAIVSLIISLCLYLIRIGVL